MKLNTGQEKITELEDKAIERSKMKHRKRLKKINKASVTCEAISSGLT